jgi:hypothetical protein
MSFRVYSRDGYKVAMASVTKAFVKAQRGAGEAYREAVVGFGEAELNNGAMAEVLRVYNEVMGRATEIYIEGEERAGCRFLLRDLTER